MSGSAGKAVAGHGELPRGIVDSGDEHVSVHGPATEIRSRPLVICERKDVSIATQVCLNCGSEQGQTLSTREHGAISGDVFGRHNVGRGGATVM